MVAAPIAAAQEPGVHLNPDAPASKEYAIPLAQARSNAGGGTGVGSSAVEPGAASGEAARFGVGITPVRDKPVAAGPARRHQLGASARYEPATEAPAAVARAAQAAARGQVPSSNSGLWWSAAAALLVLVGGAAGASALTAARRRDRKSVV